MKKFLFILFGLFVVAGAFAAGENIPTSKSYVDAALATKQDKISANDGAARVLTNTGTAGEYGTKGIYDSTGEYALQTQNLVDATTMNAGVQNAIDSEFQCIEYDESGECLLMQLGGITQVPAGYTQLKYLESTGRQYIDTGIAPTNTTGLMVKFNRQTDGDQVVVGILMNPPYTSQMEVDAFNGNLILAFAQAYSNSVCGSMTNNNDYTVSINYKNNRKRFINGASTLDITNTLIAPNNTMYMFAARRVRDNTNIPYFFLKGRIYYLQITEGMNTVRNFIPARRNSDGVLGMYDTVSNTFFTNAGTGEFIAGPIVYLPNGE